MKMQIKYNKAHGIGGKAFSSVQSVIARGTESMADGSLERARDEVEKLTEIVGTLVDVLASKGILNVEDVLEISGIGWSYDGAQLIQD